MQKLRRRLVNKCHTWETDYLKNITELRHSALRTDNNSSICWKEFGSQDLKQPFQKFLAPDYYQSDDLNESLA